jgi:hypothetical protein
LLSEVFRRTFQGGWLIISGPAPAIDDRGMERLLEIIDLSRPMLVLRAGGSLSIEIEGWVEDLGALLEVDQQFLEPQTAEDPTLQYGLQEAGLIVAGGVEEASQRDLYLRWIAPALDQHNWRSDQILYFVGVPGTIIGEWRITPQLDRAVEGIGWLPGGMILQEGISLAELEPVQDILRNQPRSYVLNLLGGATIALGPAGEIDLWGSPSPAIILGRGWGET